MARRGSQSFDSRLLSHHPAGKQCLDVCTANGWQPNNADVLRLVRLWDEVRRGQRSEVAISPARLQFARWLVTTGRLGEDLTT